MFMIVIFSCVKYDAQNFTIANLGHPGSKF